MIFTTMPETAVNENSHSLRQEDKIRFAFYGIVSFPSRKSIFIE